MSRHQRQGLRGVMTLQDIVRAGLVRLPLEIQKDYKGHHLVGRITLREMRRGEGASTALSTAAGMARASVIGIPPVVKYPQTNGWIFWQFVDVNGSVKSLDVLLDSATTVATPAPARDRVLIPPLDAAPAAAAPRERAPASPSGSAARRSSSRQQSRPSTVSTLRPRLLAARLMAVRRPRALALHQRHSHGTAGGN